MDNEVAELHPLNHIDVIGPDVSRQAPESFKNEVASGIPNDFHLDSKQADYLIKISDLKPCAPKAYCPMYKSIQESQVKNGQQIITFDQWLNRMDLLVKKYENGKRITHVTFNGGKFSIPDDREAEFLKWYAVSLSLNKYLWFVEQRTHIFRYYVDLDFMQLVPLTERVIHATSVLVQRVIRNFFPETQREGLVTIAVQDKERIGEIIFKETPSENSLRAIVCTTNYKFINAKNGNPEMVKTGIHILWPNLYMDRERALDIRESIIAELEREFGKRIHPLNTWQDVVDCSVYGKSSTSGGVGGKGSGLRMLGSRKTEECPTCRGKSRGDKKKNGEFSGGCDMCLNNGKVDTGRPYYVLCVLNSFGSRDYEAEEYYRRDLGALIVDTKIRTTFQEAPKHPIYVVPERAPLRVVDQSGVKKGTTATGARKPADAKLSSSTKQKLQNSSLEWDLIHNVIRACANGTYKNTIITEITTNARNSQYIVHIGGESCRYCHNIKREHTSNRIYFVVDSNGVTQRCHDNAGEISPEMQFGLCRDYVGFLNRLHHAEVKQLFPSSSTAQLEANIPNLAIGADHESDAEYDENAQCKRWTISDDRKLAKLYKIGDALSKQLFNKTWSDTLRTSEGEHVIARQRMLLRRAKTTSAALGDAAYSSVDDYYSMRPSSLGSKGNNAMADLGFSDLMDSSLKDSELNNILHKDARKKFLKLYNLTEDVFKALDMGVELACNMNLTEISCCKSFDELFFVTSENNKK